MSFQISSPTSVDHASPQTIAAQGGNRLGRCEERGVWGGDLITKTWLMPGELARGRCKLTCVVQRPVLRGRRAGDEGVVLVVCSGSHADFRPFRSNCRKSWRLFLQNDKLYFETGWRLTGRMAVPLASQTRSWNSHSTVQVSICSF